jgi:hypothetical protein
MAKPKGHKKSCRCAVCKNARKGKSKGKRSGSKKKSGRTTAEHRAHVKRLRVELRQVKTGERAASRNGDAKSWASFTAKRKSLEAQIRR